MVVYLKLRYIKRIIAELNHWGLHAHSVSAFIIIILAIQQFLD